MVRFKQQKKSLVLVLSALCWCLWIGLSSLMAQSLIFDAYAIREGLSNRLVGDIEMDKSGLVWLATGNGLNRFDGYEFVTFSNSEKVSQNYRLSQSYIKEIACSPDHRLLVFFEDLYTSFDIIDVASFEVEKVEVTLQIKGQARRFYVDEAGNVFVVSKSDTFTAVYVYDYGLRAFQEVCLLNEKWIKQYPVIDLLVDRHGKVILYDDEHGLRAWEPTTKEVDYYQGTSPGQPFNTSDMSIFYQDDAERVWLAFKNVPGLYTLADGKDSLELYTGLSTDKIYCDIWEDDRGNLIFSQGDINGNFPFIRQLFCLSEEGAIFDFSHLLEVGNYLLSIYSKDFFRTIFIGTDTGLKVVQNTTTRLQRYLNQRIGEDQRGYSMRGICEDKEGNIYFSREVTAWYKLDVENDLIDTIRLHDKFGNYLDYNNCQGIWYDTTGYLWGVTGDGTDRRIGYLHQYDLENCNNQIFEYQDAFTAYAKKDNEHFVLGARSSENRGALVFFDSQTQTFSRFLDKENNNPFASVYIRYLLVDGVLIWVGTEQGLFKVNMEDLTWQRFIRGEDPQSSEAVSVNLADNFVYSLFLDEQETLWIGTLNGLSSYDKKTAHWKSYTTRDGLVSNTIACILSGGPGALWISTYNGLSYFTPDRDDSRSFFQIDGLSHNEFNRFSAFNASDGHFYFGGVNGINAFKEYELLVSRDIPKVLLTSFSHYNSKLDSTIVVSANLLENPSIVIEPHYSYFSFDFALPIYTPTANNQFRYRIGNDPDQEWIYLKGDRSLRYNDIKSGTYKIYVQGADPNGNWGKESLVLNMFVKEIFYKSTWFIILAIFLLAAFVYGLLRYRLEEKLRMERLRTQLASDLHDEVSGLLAGISLQSELLRSQINEPSLDLKLQNIRQASQRAMSKMSDVIWSIDSRRDRLRELINRMEEHADEVLLPLEIRYHLETHQLENDGPIPANIRQNIYFIYKEAINNVAKHAQAKQVEIWMGNRGSNFELRIEDDGIGADDNGAKRGKKGQGLANLRMRAQRLGAELTIQNGKGFTIHLRMKKFI
ncbi:two-component regulator propeller domain-containing protein [Lewinella sp. LCG006]|uniref:sensor histidine kinase n=1 Tax=Lewinella sp. LCG006 TaxID=3231911 RepID=UPI003460FA2B